MSNTIYIHVLEKNSIIKRNLLQKFISELIKLKFFPLHCNKKNSNKTLCESVNNRLSSAMFLLHVALAGGVTL